MKFKGLKLLGVGACVSAALIACESKFAEKSPDLGEGAGAYTLEDRMANKQTLDQKLNDVEKLATRTKQILDLFRKYQQGNDGSLYTPVDLLADVSRELKKGIPISEAGVYEKEGRIHLPVRALSPECQVVDARFRTAAVPSGGVDEETGLEIPGDHATIALRTCKTNGQYVETFILDGHGGQIDSLKLANDALGQLFPLNVGGEIGKIRNACSFIRDQDEVVQKVTCQNFTIPINKVNTAVVDSFIYDLNGDVLLESTGTVYQLGQPRLSTYVKLEKNKIPVVLINDIDSSSEQAPQ